MNDIYSTHVSILILWYEALILSHVEICKDFLTPLGLLADSGGFHLNMIREFDENVQY